MTHEIQQSKSLRTSSYKAIEQSHQSSQISHFAKILLSTHERPVHQPQHFGAQNLTLNSISPHGAWDGSLISSFYFLY